MSGLLRILDLQRHFELAIAELYGEFAVVFPDDGRFWQGLRSAEQGHARGIERLSRAISTFPDLFTTGRPVSAAAINTAIAGVNEQLKRVRSREIDRAGTFASARDIERSLLELKLAEIVHCEKAEHRQIMRTIAEETAAHYRLVEDQLHAALGTTELRKVLSLCGKLELKVATLYHLFADLLYENGEAVQLFQKTAGDEEQHSRQFEFALRLKDLPGETVITPAMVDEKFQLVDRLLADAREHKITFPAALNRAIQLESALAEFHMTSAVSFADPSMKKLFSSMMNFDQDHVSRLTEVRKRLVVQ